MQAISLLETVSRECRDLASEPVPARAAWAAIASAIRPTGLTLTRRRSGWRRTHYADPNASGTSGCTYTEDIGIVLGDQSSGVRRAGGQNSGHYEFSADSDCLFFSVLSGEIYELCDVDGSWSQWQGSSSSYELRWRRYEGDITDEMLDAVVAQVAERLTKRRDFLRRRKVAGAAAATRILSALNQSRP
jgi:hypothetical protein